MKIVNHSPGHFRLEVFKVSRKNGGSSSQLSAYQTRATLRCPTKKQTYCHVGRNEEVIAAGLALPTLAPVWARDRELLWHANEVHNKRMDARVAIGVIISIDHRLDLDRRIAIAAVHEFSGRIAETHSVPVDFAIHRPPTGGDRRQIHAHVLIGTSTLGSEGFGNKQRYFDVAAQRRGGAIGSKMETYITQLRRWWEEICNAALEKLGSFARVDRRRRAVRCREAWRMWNVEVAQELEGPPRQYLEPGVFRRTATEKNACMFHHGFAGMLTEEINEWLPPALPTEVPHVTENLSLGTSRIPSASSPQSIDGPTVRHVHLTHSTQTAHKAPDSIQSVRRPSREFVDPRPSERVAADTGADPPTTRARPKGFTEIPQPEGESKAQRSDGPRLLIARHVPTSGTRSTESWLAERRKRGAQIPEKKQVSPASTKRIQTPESANNALPGSRLSTEDWLAQKRARRTADQGRLPTERAAGEHSVGPHELQELQLKLTEARSVSARSQTPASIGSGHAAVHAVPEADHVANVEHPHQAAREMQHVKSPEAGAGLAVELQDSWAQQQFENDDETIFGPGN